MEKIRNRRELADFIDILTEFECVYGDEYSSFELMDAAVQLIGIAKGEVAKKKTYDGGLSSESRIVDTFTMMTKQPKRLTMHCVDDFRCLEDCAYSNFAKKQQMKEFLER